MTPYDHVNFLCEKQEITIYKLEKDLSLAKNTIKNWESGVMPTCRIIQMVADYFDVSIDYLLDRTSNSLSHKEPTSLAETKILNKIRELEITEFESDVLTETIEAIIKGFRKNNGYQSI